MADGCGAAAAASAQRGRGAGGAASVPRPWARRLALAALGSRLRLRRRRSLAGAGGGRLHILALAGQHRDHLVDRHVRGAFRHHDLGDRALVDRLDLHGRLVGLDLGDDVAGLDLVALLLQPLGEVALLHRGRQRRHEDVDRHGVSASSVSRRICGLVSWRARWRLHRTRAHLGGEGLGDLDGDVLLAQAGLLRRIDRAEAAGDLGQHLAPLAGALKAGSAET